MPSGSDESRDGFALRADSLRGPQGPFDVVVSNPPYIRSDRHAGPAAPRCATTIRALALDGGADGLAAYRTILARAPGLLAQGRLAGAGSGLDQAEAVAGLCRAGGMAGRGRIRAICRGRARRDRYRPCQGERLKACKKSAWKIRMIGLAFAGEPRLKPLELASCSRADDLKVAESWFACVANAEMS